MGHLILNYHLLAPEIISDSLIRDTNYLPLLSYIMKLLKTFNLKYYFIIFFKALRRKQIITILLFWGCFYEKEDGIKRGTGRTMQLWKK